MSKFNFDDDPVKTVESRVTVEGSFMCQMCGETVDEALYLPDKKVLTWRCFDKHISTVKDYHL